MTFSVSWGAYQDNICHGLSSLQQKEQFVDLTLAADGHHVKVHQLVLSLVSPYIQELIASAPCPHPVIFLNKISYETLTSILQYAYTGEVMVARDKMGEFLVACKALHIRGIDDMGTHNLENEDYKSGFETISNNDTDILGTTPASLQDIDKTQNNYDENNDDDEVTMDAACDDDDFDDIILATNEQGGSATIKAKKPANPLGDRAMQLQYTVSNKGNIQLVCNRYLYFLMSSRKSGERMWRCHTYKRGATCRAFITTKDNKVIKRVGAHNHPFHDKQIMKRMEFGNMFSALNDAESSVTDDMKKGKQSATYDT